MVVVRRCLGDFVSARTESGCLNCELCSAASMNWQMCRSFWNVRSESRHCWRLIPDAADEPVLQHVLQCILEFAVFRYSVETSPKFWHCSPSLYMWMLNLNRYMMLEGGGDRCWSLTSWTSSLNFLSVGLISRYVAAPQESSSFACCLSGSATISGFEVELYTFSVKHPIFCSWVKFSEGAVSGHRSFMLVTNLSYLNLKYYR